MKQHFGQITVIGTGFIGGSVGLMVKAKGLADCVVGNDSRIERMEDARKARAIDRYDADVGAAIRGSSLTILASPVGTFRDIVQACFSSFEPGMIVTDVGSVKGPIVDAVDALLPPDVHFVGAHPIAGSEKSGAHASREDLFRDMRCIVTPTATTDADALAIVQSFWTAAGSEVVVMDPFVHDRVFGAVSHLPHILAYASLTSLGLIRDTLIPETDVLSYSAQAFKDMTRIASSSPALWSDICCWNADNLVSMIDIYQNELERLKQLVKQRDRRNLETAFADSKAMRDHLD